MYTTKKHSESSFSNGGQILTPHRSKLLLDTMKALMCLQDWLWINKEGMKLTFLLRYFN